MRIRASHFVCKVSYRLLYLLEEWLYVYRQVVSQERLITLLSVCVLCPLISEKQKSLVVFQLLLIHVAKKLQQIISGIVQYSPLYCN